jgi:hypothetical protein
LRLVRIFSRVTLYRKITAFGIVENTLARFATEKGIASPLPEIYEAHSVEANAMNGTLWQTKVLMAAP